MILGVGTDFIEKKRVEKILKKYGDRFINKILSDSEKKNFSSVDKTKKVNFLTSAFSSKESFVKALGTGFREIYPRDISIIKNKSGKPSIQCDLIRDYKAHLSVTNDEKYTLSMVIIEK